MGGEAGWGAERAQRARSGLWNRRKKPAVGGWRDPAGILAEPSRAKTTKKRAPGERSPAPSLRGITRYTRDSRRRRPGRGVGVSDPAATRDESCISSHGKRRCDDCHKGISLAAQDGRAGRIHLQEVGRSRPAGSRNDFSPLAEREGRNQTDTKPDLTTNATREARQPTTPDCPQGITLQPIRADAGRTSPPIMVNDG